MKLIIVERGRLTTFKRLTHQFIDDINVSVVMDRRQKQRRQQRDAQTKDRRTRDRRTLRKPWAGKDYVVIHIAR